jgi:ABC-2 type transport system ATP-binding protein
MSACSTHSRFKKTYANQLEALKGIDLRVEKGDFFALLGFNQSSHANQVKKLIGLRC